MTKQRNWTEVFKLAARQGQQALIHALTTAMETERAAFTEQYDAIVARQRAECEAVIEQQRTECKALLAHQRSELLAKVDDMIKAVEVEHAALRRELAAAHAELDRLRSSPAPQSVH